MQYCHQKHVIHRDLKVHVHAVHVFHITYMYIVHCTCTCKRTQTSELNTTVRQFLTGLELMTLLLMHIIHMYSESCTTQTNILVTSITSSTYSVHVWGSRTVGCRSTDGTCSVIPTKQYLLYCGLLQDSEIHWGLVSIYTKIRKRACTRPYLTPSTCS